MNWEYVGALTAGGLCVTLAVVALWRDRRTLIDWTFSVGLAVLAAEALLAAASARAYDPFAFLRLQQIKLWATALMLGTWLLFSLVFARANPRDAIRRRWWVVTAAVLPTLGLVGLFPDDLYRGVGRSSPTVFALPLGWAGKAFELIFVAGCVVILVNLERTLRASSGTMRWYIKFMALGVGGLFATRVYTSSQTLLYAAYDEVFEPFKAGALIVAVLLMGVALARSRLRNAEVHLSATALHSSFVLGAVAVYLLTTGALAFFVRRFGGTAALPLITSLVFLAVLGLTALLLSGNVRDRTRRLVSRHFRRPHYEYRAVWRGFTERTSSLVEEEDLARAVARFVSDTLRVPSVSVWLAEEAGDAVRLGGSTLYSEERARGLAPHYGQLLSRLRSEGSVVDLHAGSGRTLDGESGGIQQDVRRAVVLRAGGEVRGLMTLGERGQREPLTDEDVDLLGVMAEQAAASLLNLRLGTRLLAAKEMEAFQSLSAFFVHDLKNLASKLSLTMRNLAAHYEDPGFREDLSGVLERSASKINDLCSRLSPLSRGLDHQPRSADANEVIREALVGLEGALPVEIETDLTPLPPTPLDVEGLAKVVLNLVLNASEAVSDEGRIRVATARVGDCVVVSVTDNGRGMSREFMERSLFRPFQTTKARGLGIGLYHSRKIVEAHGGRIEVESEEGRGSTFRVLLPLRAS